MRASNAYLSHSEKLEIWRLRDEGLSQRAIAERIGCGKTAVARLLRKPRPNAPPIPQIKSDTPQSPIAFRASKLMEVAQDIQYTRERGSVHVLPQLHRLHLSIHTELQEMRAKEEDIQADMDMDGLIATIVDTVATLPPLVRETIKGQLESCEAATIIDISERRDVQ